MPLSTRIDRVRGCLLGMAIGDALGAPLEGLGAQQIRAHYQLVTDYVDGARAWKKKPYRWRLPGLYSDDTQQALALCRRPAGARPGRPRPPGGDLPGDGHARGGLRRGPPGRRAGASARSWPT